MRLKTILTLILICAIGSALADSLHVSLAGHYGASNSARRVNISGTIAYIADDDNGLCIIDISDPSSPSGLVHYYTGDPPFSVFVSGDYAYVTYAGYFSWKGLQIFDISYPSSPFEVGLYEMEERAYGVFVSGDYAYVADSDSGLRIIDVSIPSLPSKIGFYVTGDRAHGVYVSGSYAYVADKEDGLRIIDVSDPFSPYEVGFYDTGDLALDVYISGDYAYVADYEDGLRIIDISDPSSPTEVGLYSTAGGAIGVYVSGSYAYIADEFNGLQIIDISSPSFPFRAGFYNTAYYTVDVFVSDRYAYVVCGDSGLYILDVSYFTGIEENSPSTKPEAFSLSAYPNPFNSSVTIALDIPVGDGSPVPLSVKIYDVAGRMVAVAEPVEVPVGEGLKPSRSSITQKTGGSKTAPLRNGEFIWRPDESLGSGVFLIRATVGGETSSNKIIYLK